MKNAYDLKVDAMFLKTQQRLKCSEIQFHETYFIHITGFGTISFHFFTPSHKGELTKAQNYKVALIWVEKKV